MSSGRKFLGVVVVVVVLAGLYVRPAGAQTDTPPPPTNTPVPPTSTSVPGVYDTFTTPTAFVGNLTCPQGTPEGWGVATPSVFWGVVCGQCMGAIATSTPGAGTPAVPTPTPGPGEVDGYYLLPLLQVETYSDSWAGFGQTVARRTAVVPEGYGVVKGYVVVKGNMTASGTSAGSGWGDGVAGFDSSDLWASSSPGGTFTGVGVGPYYSLIYAGGDPDTLTFARVSYGGSETVSPFDIETTNVSWHADPGSYDAEIFRQCNAGSSCSWSVDWGVVAIMYGTQTVGPSYCSTVDEVNPDDTFSWDGISVLTGGCIDIGPYDVDFLGWSWSVDWLLHLCADLISFGTIQVFGVGLEMDSIMVLMGVVTVIRWLT